MQHRVETSKTINVGVCDKLGHPLDGVAHLEGWVHYSTSDKAGRHPRRPPGGTVPAGVASASTVGE